MSITRYGSTANLEQRGTSSHKHAAADTNSGNFAYVRLPTGTGTWDVGSLARITFARGVTLGESEGMIHLGSGGDTTSKQNIWTTGATPLAIQRTSSATNASIQAKTTGGSVYFGYGPAGEFAVDDDADLTDAPFRVNAANGNTRIGGTLTLAAPGTATTVGAAGAAAALPANPTGYLVVTIGSTAFKLPYYTS